MRFPFHFQYDTMQCGATCLQMVLDYYGHACTLDEVEEFCPSTSQGVSMLSIDRAAQHFGLETTCCKVKTEQLTGISLPCILFWNQNHFVVLYKISHILPGKTQYYVADPGKGRVSYTESEIKTHWLSNKSDDKGIVLLLRPSKDFVKIRRQRRNRISSFKELLGYFRGYRRLFFQVMIGLLLGCVFQLIMPFLTQAIVDVGIQQRDISIVGLILVGQFVLVISGSCVDFIRRWNLLFIGMRIDLTMLSDFFTKLVKLPMSFFETKHTGDILQRMGDYGRLENFLTEDILSILFSIVSMIVFSIVLFCYNDLIFIVFFSFSLFYALWMRLFLHKRKILDYRIFEKRAESQDRTYQFVTSMQEIKLQGCEDYRRKEWEDTQVDLSHLQMRSLKLQQTQQAGSIFIDGIKGIIITALSAITVIKGDMTLGMMLSVQYIIGQLSSPVAELLGFSYTLQDIKISMERISEITSKKEEDRDRIWTQYEEDCHGLSIKDLTFSYERYASVKTLKHVSLEIPLGKVTAIVGMSGSGKTTLMKLLLGYYSDYSGEIYLGGRPLKEYNMRWWRSECGVVMQDGSIFYDTILRNITSGEDNFDVSKFEEATHIANIDSFIKSLPLGYNTKIGHGGMGLSVGQRQRILIARAVYKNPKFIFLDEATNSLDANNERSIVKQLESFYKGKTVVIIAHRLSTVRNADNIVVMDNGQIAEQGNHDELISRKGAYFSLVKNQLNL